MFRWGRFRASLCAALVVANSGAHSLDSAHKPVTALFKRSVRYETHYLTDRPYYRTVVNYGQLKNHREWREYIKDLPYVSSSSVKSSPEAARKAFWINTYNTMVIDAVARNYPMKPGGNISDYPSDSFRGNPAAWNTPLYVAGETLTFDAIHTILMDFDDPRVLLAISSAAHSSPALPRMPYDSGSIEFQLDDAVQNFCIDPVNVRLDRPGKTLYISELFKRHADLFRRSQAAAPAAYQTTSPELRAALGFIWPYLPTDAKNFISARKPQIRYLPFNWELNDLK